MSTVNIVIELDKATDHQALVYISQVMTETQKVAALDIFQRGMAALAADPDWQAKVAAHEAQRTATLSGLGLTPPPRLFCSACGTAGQDTCAECGGTEFQEAWIKPDPDLPVAPLPAAP